MSKKNPENKAPAASVLQPESQKQRWVKYGSNVILASVVVVLLGAGLTYIATMKRFRTDTTKSGLYSLKPQTKAILKGLKQPVKIVSLYSNSESSDVRDEDRQKEQEERLERSSRVAGLLDEYKRSSGGQIDVEIIDPVKQPTKVDDLINDVTIKYGGEVQKYKAFLEAYPKQFEAIKKQVAESAAQLPMMPFANEKMPEAVQLAIQTIPSVSNQLDRQREQFDKLLKQKPPNYKAATDAVNQGMDVLSQIADRIIEDFTASKDDEKIAAPIRKYLTDSIPRYRAIKKSADDIKAEIGKLGELKLDELRQKLRERDAILVMGPKDMRTLSAGDVWQLDPNMRRVLQVQGKELKARFAGEQQLTSAILALTQEKKPKIAFVRGGGPPLAQEGNPFTGPPGDFAVIAERLRGYNFDVLEKDLSGMWAVQQQMMQQQRGGGMPPMPEPSDEDIKDAIWVLVMQPAPPTEMGNADISSKIAAHLQQGGSAMMLFTPQSENLAAALSEWGIAARTDAVIVHETTPPTGAQGDFINEAKRLPHIFIVNSYGKHMLTEPLESLDAPLVAAVPIVRTVKAGYDGASLIPIPNSPPIWGETSIPSLRQSQQKNDPATDIQGPLFAGAAVQKKDGGRLVVLGTIAFATNDILMAPDQELLQRGVAVARFPGSSELFTNSILWLAKLDPMIAISPAAMEVNRIDSISPGALAFWRWGVLMIGLPAAVLIAGGLMYLRRRD